jgi:hypothetical protein
MSKKLHLIGGTLFTLALFLFFHALLAVTTILWFVFLLPGMLFRWTIDETKAIPIRARVERH